MIANLFDHMSILFSRKKLIYQEFRSYFVLSFAKSTAIKILIVAYIEALYLFQL